MLARYEAVLLTHGTYTLDLKNSIAAGGGADIRTSNGLEGPGNLVVANTNFDTAKEEIGTEVVNAGGNQTASPLFVDAANGDYREAAGSPTIDAGVADPLIGGPTLAGGRERSGPGPTSAPTRRPIHCRRRRSPARSSRWLAPRGLQGRKIRRRHRQQEKDGGCAGRREGDLLALREGERRIHDRAKDRGAQRQGKCVKRTKANAAKKKCAILKPVNPCFAQAAQAGRNLFRFSGRLGNKPLPPGAYRLLGSAGGAVKQASFKIVK